MADMDFRQGSSLPENLVTRYKDIGGGVHAPVVAAILDGGSADIQIGDVEMGRDSAQLNLTYDTAVDPTTFIDKRSYSMVAVGPIPAACNGLTMTPIVASGAAGADKAIPKFLDSAGTLTAFYGVAVSTGDFITLQAEIAPHPFIGLRFSGAVATTVPVWLMG